MKNTVIGFVVVLACFTMLSCGKQNPLSPPVTEVHQEINFSDDKIAISGDEFIYRQYISLSHTPEYAYSYRLHTIQNILPEGIYTDDEGWLYFLAPGYNNAALLSQPGTHRSVWTSSHNISMDFASANAKISNLVNRVEIRIKKPSGEISHLESPFKSDRLISSRIVVPFGFGDTTGTGIEFKLQEFTNNIFVDGMFAHHFMYRLNRLDSEFQVINFGEWHSSIDCPDIRSVILNGYTNPSITITPGNYTVFESYVVSRLGVEESSVNSVVFRPVSGNKPKAIVFPSTIVGLGQYHQSFSYEPASMAFYSQIEPSEQNGYNSPLWGSGSDYYAINSNDFKLHLRWGYSGQYNNDDPFTAPANICLNEQGLPYYSKIVAYDLRWNGAPFPTQPGFFEPEVVSHSDGSSWLRVKNIIDASRRVVLQQLPNGTHNFQVCAVDIQNVYSNPTSINITLSAYKPPSQRNGILIIDDSIHSTSSSPEPYVDAFYNAVVPNTWGNVVNFDLAELSAEKLPQGSFMLQNYKAVVWHSDNPSNSGKLKYNYTALRFYLSHGGNMLISGTSKLLQELQALYNTDSGFTSQYMGINVDPTELGGSLGTSITNNPYFYQAIGQNGNSNIDLETTTSFNSIVNSRKGIGAVTYFNPGAGLNYIHRFGCKTPGMDSYSPTQAQYELYSSKYVAYKHSYNGANVVVFGFPLSYMEQADVTSSMQTIIGNILGSKDTQWRKQ